MMTSVHVRSVLTRCIGYLRTVTSHSLQPYRGCALGNSLCGVGCYVQHNPWVTNGRPWGSFVEARVNAAEVYVRQCERERRWARERCGAFGVFLSSSTEPFQPIERKLGVTRSVLTAMVDRPPDRLIVQTHSHHVLDAADLLEQLHHRCDLRIHISIETDRERLAGLPAHASSVARRIEAGRTLKHRGLFTVATVSPLLPIDRPEAFFRTLAGTFDAIVIDHYIGGDGSRDGARTRRTPLPILMQSIETNSVTLSYRDAMVDVARQYCDRVGVSEDGFAGRYLAGFPEERRMVAKGESRDESRRKK